MLKLAFALFCAMAWNASVSATRTVGSHLGAADMARLQKVFIEGLTSKDLQALYYSSLNIEPTSPEDKLEFCQRLLTLHAESSLNDYEKDFYLIGAHKNARCANKLPEELLSKVYAAFKEDLTTSQEIYYRVSSFKVLGVKIDEATTTKLVKNLQELLKQDDSLAGLGYAFNVAAELGPAAAFVAERVEDAIVQADEVDEKILQFEGGLSITALVVNSAFSVAKAHNKPVPIDAEQAVKLATYFLSRRSVQTPKGAHVLIESLKTIGASSGNIAPICIQLIGSGQLQASSPDLSIMAVDLLGKPLAPQPQQIFGKVTMKKANTVLAEKVQFVSRSSDKTVFVADLAAFKPTRGIYVVDISADGIYTQKLQFKVLGKVKVHSLEVGVSDADASSTLKKQSVAFPNTLSETLQADNTQKLILRTVLVDEGTTKVITVHQAFVRLYNKATDEEIIFIAEQDTSKTYKFDIDVGARGADFGYKSGLYEMNLIIGDASLSNSFKWHVANIELKFAQEPKEPKKQHVRAALPEIHHQFRVPEKRPPRIVSDIFTGLCIFPLVVLLIFWGKMGVNVSNFTFSLSTIGFHLGFGSILILFCVFWVKLNMFETLRLLIPLAIFTFLCGNRMLRRMYAQRVAKNPTS